MCEEADLERGGLRLDLEVPDRVGDRGPALGAQREVDAASTSRSPRRIQRSSPRSKTSAQRPGAERNRERGRVVNGDRILRGGAGHPSPPLLCGAERIRTTPPLSMPLLGTSEPPFDDPPVACSKSMTGAARTRRPYPAQDGGFDAINRTVRMAFVAALALGTGGARRRGRGPAAADRPRALLRQPRDRGRPALARRPVHRLPEAVEGHAQHLGEEDRRAVRQGAARHGRHEAADPGLLLEPRQQVHPLRPGQGRRRELQRLRREPGRRRRRPARTCPRRATSPTPRAPAPIIYAVPKSDARHDLRRPERPRCGLARPLQGEDLDRRARRCVRKNTERIARLGLRQRRASCGSATRDDRQRRHRDPPRRRRRLHEGLLLHRVRDAAAPVRFHKDGKRVYMETNKGDARPRRGSTLLRSGDAARKSSSSPIR